MLVPEAEMPVELFLRLLEFWLSSLGSFNINVNKKLLKHVIIFNYYSIQFILKNYQMVFNFHNFWLVLMIFPITVVFIE